MTKYLAKKQSEVDADSSIDVEKKWKGARKTQKLKEVHVTLCKMAGDRERCMYCEDSRGADIEHFRPKIRFRESAFVWENMLLVCTPCNRRKGDQFPIDVNNVPQIVDPSAENPWDHLFYEPRTGRLAPKFDVIGGQFDPKGKVTTDESVLTLNDEAVINGRKRTARCLRRAVERFMVGPGVGEQTLVDEIYDHRDYGLANWFFLDDGANEPPFSDLRQDYPSLWVKIEKVIQD